MSGKKEKRVEQLQQQIKEVGELQKALVKKEMNANVKGLAKVIKGCKEIPKGFHRQLMFDPKKNELWLGDQLSETWKERYSAEYIDCGDMYYLGERVTKNTVLGTMVNLLDECTNNLEEEILFVQSMW